MTGGRPEAEAWHVRSPSAAWATGLDTQRQRTRRKRARATQITLRRSREQVELPILITWLALPRNYCQFDCKQMEAKSKLTTLN